MVCVAKGLHIVVLVIIQYVTYMMAIALRNPETVLEWLQRSEKLLNIECHGTRLKSQWLRSISLFYGSETRFEQWYKEPN
nr:hypothetical protein [Tanacetum cinerariifolium]